MDRTRYRLEFDYPGSFDASAWITTPQALEFVSTLVPGGIDGFRAANNALCLSARNAICNALGVAPAAPDAMLGAMAAVVLPAQSEAKEKALAQRPTKYMDALQDALLNKWNIQIPIFRLSLGEGYTQRSVRICRLNCMVYNTLEQFEYLARALKAELALERA
jgi:isopenicillin-N epimerase